MKGLTLVELLVATSIAGIVVGSSGVLFGRSLSAWKIADVRLDRIAEVEDALEAIGQDLRNSGGWGAFEGEAAGFSCMVSEGPLTLKQVRYSIEQTEQGPVLGRWTLDPSGKEPELRAPLLSGIRSFSVRYGYEPKQGLEVLWLPAWRDAAAVPAKVKVELEIETPRDGVRLFEHEFWIPQGVMKQEEA